MPELEYAPAFPRKWSSTYEALEDGIIDAKARHLVFIAHLPQRFPVPLIAGDSTSIARPKARTSEDRGAQYVHTLPENAKPVTERVAVFDGGGLARKAERLDRRALSTSSDHSHHSH